MVSFKKKFYLFTLIDTWFRSKTGIENLVNLRTYSFVQDSTSSKPLFCIGRESYTLISDLTQSETELEEKFSSSVKKEVRKAESEEVEFIANQELDSFIDFYNQFAGMKSLYQVKDSMKNALTQDQYWITLAKYNGEILNAKLYLYDRELGIVRSFLSANKRSDDPAIKRKVGIAGKFLMAKSMYFFKEQGFTTYDFGGIAEGTKDKGLQGINEFKASFGGQKKKDINLDSLPYYFLRKISEKLDRRYR
jgi:hypothetical protein